MEEIILSFTIKSAIARWVNITSNRLGVLWRLLISKTNTVMFPIADRTIKILCKHKNKREEKISSIGK